MAYLNFNDVIEFRKSVEAQFGLTLHFHDSCSGQYFSSDELLNDELKEYITDYFEKKSLIVTFSEEQNTFIVK